MLKQESEETMKMGNKKGDEQTKEIGNSDKLPSPCLEQERFFSGLALPIAVHCTVAGHSGTRALLPIECTGEEGHRGRAQEHAIQLQRKSAMSPQCSRPNQGSQRSRGGSGAAI